MKCQKIYRKHNQGSYQVCSDANCDFKYETGAYEATIQYKKLILFSNKKDPDGKAISPCEKMAEDIMKRKHENAETSKSMKLGKHVKAYRELLTDDMESEVDNGKAESVIKEIETSAKNIPEGDKVAIGGVVYTQHTEE